MKNTWYSFSISDIGRKHSINQDAIYSDDVHNIWVVADGMGGHKEGEKASQAIVKLFDGTNFSNIMSERVIQIETSIRVLNTELQEYASNELNGQLIGSTIVVFTVCQGVCATIWAGDSRCYKLNNSVMSQVSWDHSQVAELVRSGGMTAEQAAMSRRSNVITRAVGAPSELYFEHVLMPYSSDDIFLLCSDGLSNELSDKIINDDISEQGCTQETIDNLLKKTLIYGARDNVSIILISCRQQKAPDTQEEEIIESFSNKLNVLANSLFNKVIELPDYYQEMANIINQSVFSSQHLREQETQELPEHQTTSENFEVREVDAEKFTKGSASAKILHRLSKNYFFLSAIATLLIVMALLVIS